MRCPDFRSLNVRIHELFGEVPLVKDNFTQVICRLTKSCTCIYIPILKSGHITNQDTLWSGHFPRVSREIALQVSNISSLQISQVPTSSTVSLSTSLRQCVKSRTLLLPWIHPLHNIWQSSRGCNCSLSWTLNPLLCTNLAFPSFSIHVLYYYVIYCRQLPSVSPFLAHVG